VPDLLSLLNNAASSLQAQRALAATASHNIENANTPGYARQRASLEAVPAELVSGYYIGRGATLAGVTQVRDRFLEAQIPAALGQAARSTAESEALQALHSLDPGTSGGLGDAIAGFYTSLRALAQNAGDTSLRVSVLGTAGTLARSFNRVAGDIAGARGALDSKLEGLAGEVNSEARAVADLNGQIRTARGVGAEPNDLLDLRQQHLDKLAELVGATVVPTSEGDVNVVLPGGAALVAGGSAATLSTEADVANRGHLRVLLQGVDGSGPSALPGSAFSGSLGGALAARDGALADAEDGVDHLAFDLGSALNAAQANGFDLNNLAGGPIFAVGGAWTGAAGRMRLVLADPSGIAAARVAGAPGDATNLLDGDPAGPQDLVGTESNLPGGRNVQGALAEIVSRFGADAQRAAAYAQQDGAVRDHLQALRDSTSGVSIDEELIQMQQAQRGYEAISKVIQAADQMLQTLMELR
jgi:flagellar hook-associated protein 1 FlgK